MPDSGALMRGCYGVACSQERPEAEMSRKRIIKRIMSRKRIIKRIVNALKPGEAVWEDCVAGFGYRCRKRPRRSS